MDATTAGVILLFVITILSSVGGNHSAPSSSQTEALSPPAIVNVSGQLNWHYAGADDPSTTKNIQQFVMRYRKPDEALEISSSIMRYSQAYDVNPKLVAALMRRESGFNPNACSSSGAMGLGQLLPSTCKTVGIEDGYDIDQNAKGTVRYMRYLLDKFNGFSDPVSFAIAGYLEGPNGVERNRSYSTHAQTYINDIFEIYNRI